MTYEEYVKYLNGAIEEYNKNKKNHLLKLYVEKGFAQDCSQVSINNFMQEGTDVQDKELLQKLKCCIRSNKKATACFEQWEFIKDYKYSIIFQANNFEKLIEVVKYQIGNLQKEDNENNLIFHVFKLPVFFENESQIILKFNFPYTATHPQTEEKLYLKYPVLMVIHKDEKLIEIRFDQLKSIFVANCNKGTMYTNIIRALCAYVESNYQVKLEAFDLNYIVSIVKKDVDETIKLAAENKQLKNGGSAHLDVGKNENYVMPIIGELKEMLSKHENELLQVPQLKADLDDFIYENEELSQYDCIEVVWIRQQKTKSFKVKFIFNYKNNAYCLLQHYYNDTLIGMERMNHVIQCIDQYRNNNGEDGVSEP